LKWKSWFAVLMGLLMIGSSLIFVGAKSFVSQSVGIYDPHPTFKDDLKDAISISAGAGSLEGKVFIGNKTLPIEKRFSLVNC